MQNVGASCKVIKVSKTNIFMDYCTCIHIRWSTESSGIALRTLKTSFHGTKQLLMNVFICCRWRLDSTRRDSAADNLWIMAKKFKVFGNTAGRIFWWSLPSTNASNAARYTSGRLQIWKINLKSSNADLKNLFTYFVTLGRRWPTICGTNF